MLRLALAAVMLTGAAAHAAEPGVDPVTARYDEASASIKAAASSADRTLAVLDGVPLEMAGVLVTVPYGDEPLQAVAGPTPAQVAATISMKRAYWTSIKKALDKEAVQLAADEASIRMRQSRVDALSSASLDRRLSLIQSMSLTSEKVGDEVMFRQVERQQGLVTSVLADVEADAAFVSKPRDPGAAQALIARKRAVFTTLAAFK
ncbi:MAG: hypothetical protein KGL53_08985 [Elusimicrobia bacterium]|nr:hypothetical protein [Elusimicrobiota bacterium]